MIQAHDVIGLCGISLSLYCYGRAQWRSSYMKRTSYSVLNFVSALLLGESLIHNWNLASFTANAIWGLISLWGLVRSLGMLGRPYSPFTHRNSLRPLGRKSSFSGGPG